jgi:hypothetical protein
MQLRIKTKKINFEFLIGTVACACLDTRQVRTFSLLPHQQNEHSLYGCYFFVYKAGGFEVGAVVNDGLYGCAFLFSVHKAKFSLNFF